MNTNNINDEVWSKFLQYLEEIAPRKIFITKTVKNLVAEARKVAPSDPRLEGIEAFVKIVSRPENQNERSKFTF
jgi:hypothetical protein